MRTRYQNILGKTVSLTATEAAWCLGTAVCESILSPDVGKPADKNIFGRPLSWSGSGDISFSSGFASTGLRAGSFLRPEDIPSNIARIQQAVRLHIPLAIFATVENQFQLTQLAKTGAVVFLASHPQEALDLLLNAFRIAELSLIPVLICVEEAMAGEAHPVLFPGADILASFAGDTDEFIPSPTPSQQIIFGKNRRRIPNWSNPDNPVSIGGLKQTHEAALETAAQQTYFYSHLDEIIAGSFDSFANSTERKYADIEIHSPKSSWLSGGDPGYLVISYGSISDTVNQAAETARSDHKLRITTAKLLRLSPFPAKAIAPLLAGRKGVTVLEQAVSGSQHPEIFKELSCLPEGRSVTLFSGIYGSLPPVETLPEVLLNMTPGGKGLPKFWIDIDFTRSGSAFPKHQVLLQAIQREYPDAQDTSISSKKGPRQHPQMSGFIPQSIRQYKDQGPAYSRLSRFYDDTAAFFESRPEELIADPFQAIPLMPPATAAFSGESADRNMLPVFDSANCSGCGDCFLHCPHSAIQPVAIGMENLIKAGIGIANTKGAAITQLTPLIKNLAKGAHSIVKEQKAEIRSVSDFIPAAFEKLAAQMKMEGGKLQSAQTDIEALTNALQELPLSLTGTFYDEPELYEKGKGEFFSLAINPNACTGCSVCASVCPDDALEMTSQSPDLIPDHLARYALWEQLPDTASDTITRLLDGGDYNPFSAVLLSRYFSQSLFGGAGPDAPSRSVVHLITAIAEASAQPRMNEAIQKIDGLISGLSSHIHNELAAALPSQNFEALSKALSEASGERDPFEQVIAKLGMSEHLKLVDSRILKRKIDLTESLRKLKWLLSEGVSGAGRSRMSLSVESELEWSHAYPWNHFSVPVFVRLSGSSVELEKGIIQGNIRQILDNIKLLRRAALEMTGKYEPAIHDAGIAAIGWNDLTDEEKHFVPPIILVGSRARLAGNALNGLIHLLDSDWPVKIMVLDDAAPEPETAAAEIIAGTAALLSASFLQKVQVLKGSLAAPEQLFAGLSAAFHQHTPALVWVYVPEPSKHSIAPEAWPKLNALSLNSRAFPLFRFKPDREGALFSAKTDLDGNPQSDSLWNQSSLSYQADGEEKTAGYSLSWADWAFTLAAWKDEFVAHPDGVGTPVPLTEFLALPETARTGKVPVIYRIAADSGLKKYRVSEKVVAATEACQKAWQLMREIAGELSEFPEKIHKKVSTELSEKYKLEAAGLKAEYEARISRLEAEFLEKIRIRLTDKLVSLSRSKEN